MSADGKYLRKISGYVYEKSGFTHALNRQRFFAGEPPTYTKL